MLVNSEFLVVESLENTISKFWITIVVKELFTSCKGSLKNEEVFYLAYLRERNWGVADLTTFQTMSRNQPRNLEEDVTVQSVCDTALGCRWVLIADYSYNAKKNQEAGAESSGVDQTLESLSWPEAYK